MAKKLYRSKKDCVIAGVCGGIAEYFEIDSTLVRLLFILIVFLGGAGVVAYIIAWIVIPPNPEQITEQEKDISQPTSKEENNRKIWGGLILIVLGLFFLLRSFFPHFVMVKFWPLVLVIIGVILILQSFLHKK
ncbi:MAG: PspC domain-containing protein [Candidatus Atribacteria bacterium]|nr:PspC domain-containing protein [Candidatus Atribacteria bacterium]